MNRFLSFADSRMSAALERLGRQAEALDFFDEITLFTEHDLSAEFTSRMGRYLTPSCRDSDTGPGNPGPSTMSSKKWRKATASFIWMQVAISTPTERIASGNT
ncbi:hypothetical protein [Akkermansia muciniphila]|uniref:hypothetical protein n=1 Tax=Akkermansia muciniphila TaxID=239935 RepID=UPI001AAF3FFC|nr:hypothetical protein [Akkermansia muciniphila]QTE99112.1 hypothetical protein J4027_04165 [Akkermansia muciniphila]QTF01426.1 hypothetical protein J4Z33_04165 [Akkermansia muciniphila]QTF03737.1 hypothetical protein J4Z36_04165 [Akkermansia muciniphila]QTF06049.1 hypothetical protein J4Z34_04165 [Akkermansia muciniphila]